MSTKTERLQILQSEMQKTVKPFVVTTKRGRVREIIGTLNTKYIPEQLQKDLKEMKEGVLQFFEIKKQKWNNMPFANVKRLKVR